jgi:hypothetical protein
MIYMIYEELTGQGMGCEMEVHRSVGSGLRECVYQLAPAIELTKKNTKHIREAALDDTRLAQTINYPKASHYPIGPLLDFGTKGLPFKRQFNKKFPPNQIQSHEC